ncbi:MAG: hypothetical protein B7X99_20445 [Rhizobiales bacterium 17-65-6]|nr:MAG: hypothetical protein B7X99_20445 [Rhizobiales bacterium 17-65-6]
MRPLDWLRYFVARLGWPGTLGLALLVSAWLVHGLDVQPRIDAGIEMEQRAERLSKQARPAREAEATRSVALSETLPGAERIPEAVARLFAVRQILWYRIDAATTAVYIQSVISGEKPAPGPLARQTECIAEAWRALTGERMRERSA